MEGLIDLLGQAQIVYLFKRPREGTFLAVAESVAAVERAILMEAGSKVGRHGGGKHGSHTNALGVVQTPSHAANMVVQTGIAQQARNETDLQRAINDYQNKLKKQALKQKNTTVRNKNNLNDSRYAAPISQKRLADTYMVGGCSMELNSAISSQKKAAMMLNSMQNSNRTGQSGVITQSSSSQKYNNTQRQRHSNQISKQSVAGPMQLEPNPVFSIIEQHMEKLAKTAERSKDPSDNFGSRGDEKYGGEYTSYHQESSSIYQTQKMTHTQSSYEDRISSEQYDEDEEQVVAYSNKRKGAKNSKTIGKKSPKNSFFVNNSTINDMSNLWSKYRRNLHEAQQKSGGGEQGHRGKVHHSQSRQGYLMAQHKQNQQMQLHLMHEKVNQYQKKLIDQLAQQTEVLHGRPVKRKERFTRSIGREHQHPKCRNPLQNESEPSTSTGVHHQMSVQMATDREAGLDEEIQQVMRNQTQDGRAISRSSATTDQESMAQNKSSSQPRMANNNRNQQQQSRDRQQVNGKVSTSIKATWTVNRTGQNNSRLGNSSALAQHVPVNSSKHLESSFTEPGGDYDYDNREISSSQLKESNNGSKHNQSQKGAVQHDSNQKSAPNQAYQMLSPSAKQGHGTGQINVNVNKSTRFDPSGSAAQRKKPGSSYNQAMNAPQQQAQQSNSRRRFPTDGKQVMSSVQAKNSNNLSVQATRNFNQDTNPSPNLPITTTANSTKDSKIEVDASQSKSGNQSAKMPPKRDQHKHGTKNFEQLMMAGSNLSPTKQASEKAPEEKEEVKKPAPAPPKEFIYNDPGVKIGNGKFGPVNLIIHEGKLWALKIIPKTTIDKTKRIEHVKNEKYILQQLRKNVSRAEPLVLRSGASQRNGTRAGRREETQDESFEGSVMTTKVDSKEPLDFIMKLHETFVDDENVNFVFEYLPGQDLFWILSNEHNLNLGKDKQRKDWVLFYCAEILCALETLHSRHIIYRDMKPDNVMIDYEGHIKLIDFGFSKQLCERNNFRTRTNCGTIGYTSPEILLGLTQGYSFSVDIWAFGIMIAELLSGSLPFEIKDDPIKLQEQILAGQIRLNREGIDQAARDFLTQIFQSDAEMRPSIDTLKKHRMFMQDKPNDYWAKIVTKNFQEVPYTPNPLKYAYLLQNKYPEVSNLTKRSAAAPVSRSETPAQGNKPEQAERDQSEENKAVGKERQASPSPEFGGRGTAQNTQAFKIGDAIGVLEKRPTFAEREHNFGLFGQGGGDFDDQGNIKLGRPVVFDQSPTLGKKKHNSLLGDFTLYRVNKEFENF